MSDRRFAAFSAKVATAAGRPAAFGLSVAAIVAWAATGPLFRFSDTWQLVINTGTTVVTFLMVFLIQSSQNRDGLAIQAKLDELIRAGAARDTFIGVERLSAEELAAIRPACPVDDQAS